MLRRLLVVPVLLGLLATPAHAHPAEVRFLGEHILPKGLTHQGTVVGGLSGIDRDPRTGEWVLISDDRVAPRYYRASISLKNGVEFTGVHSLTGPDGPYPPGTVDPEDMRIDPWTRDLAWSQEGERTDQVLIDPSVQFSHRDGSFKRKLPLPHNQRMRPATGPRRNEALEGLTFAAGGALVVSAMEGPLLQDGPPADHLKGAKSRITVQTRRGTVLKQYLYQQEPVSGGTTGVTAILERGLGVYLVLERSFVPNVGNTVRLFEWNGRTKRLLADIGDFTKPDNIEGMAWGPNGTLWLVSDDNFNPAQVTQFIALALR